VKFSGDESITNNGTLASCGGVIQNVDGRFVAAFAENLGVCTVTVESVGTMVWSLEEIGWPNTRLWIGVIWIVKIKRGSYVK